VKSEIAKLLQTTWTNYYGNIRSWLLGLFLLIWIDYIAIIKSNFISGTLCRGVNWERYNLTILVNISHCVGSEVMASICRRLSQNYQHATSGFPDLILWNQATSRVYFIDLYWLNQEWNLKLISVIVDKAKFSEVKGPRDCLSDKQRIWIHILLSSRADVEVRTFVFEASFQLSIKFCIFGRSFMWQRRIHKT
jgi:hypothetical protein